MPNKKPKKLTSEEQINAALERFTDDQGVEFIEPKKEKKTWKDYY